MAESRISTDRSKGTARAAAPAAKGAVAAKTVAAPSVVIRRVRKRVEEGPAPSTAASSLAIGDHRVSTMVDVDPETLAQFDPSPFGYAAFTGPLGTVSSAAFTDGAGIVAEAPEAEAAAPAVENVVAPPAIDVAALEQTPVEAKAPAARPAPHVETQVPEPAPAAEDEEEFSDKVSADEAQRITDAYSEQLLKREEVVAAPPVADAAADTTVKRTGPRVLGRIDLTRKPPAAKTAAAPAAPATADKPAKEGEADADRSRKKKRKVVRKEDLFDALERAHQVRPRKKKASPGQKLRKTELTVPKASKRVVRVNESTTAGELARTMGVKVGEVLGTLMRLGAMKSLNDVLDVDTATLVAEEFGYTLENTAMNLDELL